MALLLDIVHPQKTDYVDRKFKGTREQFFDVLAKSTTLYVGNLSFFTSEEQIYELFSRAGDIKRIVMGLDAIKKTPCGFCFVIYYTRKDAQDAVHYLNGTLLDERNIRVDFDWGFEEGRQFGRGKSGGQVRDEYRKDFDEGRGGYGKRTAELLISVSGPAPAGGAVYFGAGQRAWGGGGGTAALAAAPGSGGGPRKRPRVRGGEDEDDDAGAGRGARRPRGGAVDGSDDEGGPWPQAMGEGTSHQSMQEDRGDVGGPPVGGEEQQADQQQDGGGGEQPVPPEPGEGDALSE